MATPDTNVHLNGDRLFWFAQMDISVAVAIPGGWVTPVIADAGSKRMSQIASEFPAPTERAGTARPVPDDHQGDTALSNFGMSGTGSIIPVLSPPQSVLIGMGPGEERPDAVDGTLGLGAGMNATGSLVHRAIDGVAGAEMMRSVKRATHLGDVLSG